MVWLFIDGVGLGERDAAKNPLAQRSHLLSRYLDAPDAPLDFGGTAYAVDATFGVKGRPQSASNQTALLTGEPAPLLCGGHVLGYPTARLQALLAAHSLVKRLVEAGQRPTFANSYPAGYLDALGLTRRASAQADVVLPPAVARRLKPSATTCAFAAGRVPLRTLDDARSGQGLTHDIVGGTARARGLELPPRTVEEAADILWRLALDSELTLFEHYLADEAGHARNFAAALDALDTFDAFARAVLARKPADADVLICSDHGNVEDLSLRNHTLHPVPVLWFGPNAPDAAALQDVADVGRVVLEACGLSPGPRAARAAATPVAGECS